MHGGTDEAGSTLAHVLGLLRGGSAPADAQVREAAWIARCVGRSGSSTPLGSDDVTALAGSLAVHHAAPGTVVFAGGHPSSGVWVLREGQLELSVGAGRRRVVVGVLRAGDVDGDIAMLLGMPLPYTARAVGAATCLHLDRADFDRLLLDHPAIARRWLGSVAGRLASAQGRIVDLLGCSLAGKVAALLLDEARDGVVRLPQRTLAAMLGAARPSLNRVLKELERDGMLAVEYGQVRIVDAQSLRGVRAHPSQAHP